MMNTDVHYFIQLQARRLTRF